LEDINVNKLHKTKYLIVMTVLTGLVSWIATANTLATEPPAAGMVVWYMADAGVAQDPDGVTVWQDQSGNSNHADRVYGFPQLATATFPNGPHDVLRFDGNDALRLTDTSATQLTNFNIFIVANYDAGAVNERFFTNYSVGTLGTQYGYALGTNGNGSSFWWYYGSTELSAGTYAAEKNYLTIYTLANSIEKQLFVLDQDNGQTAYSYEIGSALIQYSSDPALPPHYSDIGANWIEWEGYGWFGAHRGDIAEILVYDLSDPDYITLEDPNAAFDDVRAYIYEKYGMNTTVTPVDDSPCTDPAPYEPENPSYVWDFAVDFSPSRISATDAENPHHDWSYGYGAEGNLADFHLYPTCSLNGGNPAWGDTANGPVLWRALSFPNYGIELCEVGSHPGDPASPALSNSKIRWTSPVEDIMAVSGMFGSGGPGDLWIVKDGNEVLWERQETASDEPFDLRIPVAVGTTIDFVHGVGDGWGGENKSVSIQIIRGTLRCEDLTTHMPTDLNRDCYVNLEDFALLAQNWLKCNDPLEPTCTDVP